jgi:hypothetical protein
VSAREQFSGWAIVELMGHRRLGAYVREAEIAGAAMLRLDIPEHPWNDGCTCGSLNPDSTSPDEHSSACHIFRAEGDDEPLDVYATQFYSASSLYCLTPTTEQMARAVRSRPEPVTSWELPRPALPAAPDDDAYDDDPLEFE